MLRSSISVRKFLHVALSTVCFLAFSGCSGATETKEDSKTETRRESNSKNSKFEVLETKNFSVELPGEAERTETSQSTEVGDVDVVMYTVLDGGKYSAIAYNMYPSGSIVDIDDAVKGAADATGGTIASSEKASVAGKEARDVRISGSAGGSTIFLTVLLDGTEMYQIITVVLEETTAVPDAHTRARDTFKLTA